MQMVDAMVDAIVDAMVKGSPRQSDNIAAKK